ncbi:MAG: hypothetical protein IRY85_20520, partial [Micromonosporaceae bacterium]|nr:hypothetical protein [Micromonosporaceae bacterium]
TGVRWLGTQVDRWLPDAAVTEALDRLEASAWEFARSLERAATRSQPTGAQVAAAAAEWGLAVATVGTTPTGTQLWVAGVERNVPSEGTTEDIWSCFAITIAGPGSAESGAEVERIACGGTDMPESVVYVGRWLDQRDAVAGLARSAAQVADRWTAPPAGSVVDGLRIVAADGGGPTVRVDAIDEVGTVVLGAPDTYLYGARLVAGPEVAGGATVAAVRLPVEVDPAIRAQAEADALRLVESTWTPSVVGSRRERVPWLDRHLGKLISIVRYEAAADGSMTVHLAVEVVAGGRSKDNPAPSPVVVCVEAATEGTGDRTLTKSMSVEPCQYPLPSE